MSSQMHAYFLTISFEIVDFSFKVNGDDFERHRITGFVQELFRALPASLDISITSTVRGRVAKKKTIV